MDRWWLQHPIDTAVEDGNGQYRYLLLPPFLLERRFSSEYDVSVDVQTIASRTQSVLGFEETDDDVLEFGFWLLLVPAIEHHRVALIPIELEALLRPSLTLITRSNALDVANYFRVGKRPYPKGVTPLTTAAYVRELVGGVLTNRITRLPRQANRGPSPTAPIRSSGPPPRAA